MKRKDIYTIIIALIALMTVAVTIHMAARGIAMTDCSFFGTLYRTLCMAFAGIIDIASIVVLAIYSLVENRAGDQSDDDDY